MNGDDTPPRAATDRTDGNAASMDTAIGDEAIYPVAFGAARGGMYLRDPATHLLLDFFAAKGLAQLKREDREELWYADWQAYQTRHSLYAMLLTPAAYSRAGGSFDLLRYVRFLEVFAYCSPAHGYSLQVTFLGFFSIMMGTNAALKHEAANALATGKLLALGVSEQAHGSDLLGNEFTIRPTGEGLMANGAKYYIGNAEVAELIATLGRRIDDDGRAAGRTNRAPFMLVALRPGRSACWRSLGKIRTQGVRAANVAGFAVKDYRLPAADVIAQGLDAWDAVFGTVTLGKFFLGFGSIGICEHAFEEAAEHLRRRVLYGKPALDMPHIRATMAQAYVRLTAMKLYAYRALEYVAMASVEDRRYLLYCAVQKAKVSTEGVKVMDLLRECIGARGFESDTYFEMASRDAPLIPSLEGSAHINLGLAAQFMARYFGRADAALGVPPSMVVREAEGRENPYLMEARAGAVHGIGFRPFLEAYRPLTGIPAVMSFARQAAAFRKMIRREKLEHPNAADTQMTVALGQCMATIALGQLVAENAARSKVLPEITALIYSLLVGELSGLALQLATMPRFGQASRTEILRLVKVPQVRAEDWEVAGKRF